MDAKELPPHPRVNDYTKLARALFDACNTGDPQALQDITEHYSLERPPTLEQLRASVDQRLRRPRVSEDRSDFITLAQARNLIADSHCFEDWQTFARFIEEFNDEGSPVARFEAAVDAVVTGDVTTLERLLGQDRNLIHARSSREHGATLLHYVGANGVEDFRQKTPKNAVEIAGVLLGAGAEVDADLGYAGSASRGAAPSGRVGSTTLGLVATSIHPARAGVQIALMERLLEAGASVDGIEGGWSLVNACLHNGRPEAATFLAGKGAKLDLEAAAGVGRLDLVQSFWDAGGELTSEPTPEQMRSGFVWACEFGQTAVVEYLLEKGMDIAVQAHGMTGLHWAMVGGHLDTIESLLRRNAPLEVENRYGGTVLGCAIWAVRNSDPVNRWPDPDTDWRAILELLIEAGAKVHPNDSDFPTGSPAVDELLRRHGMQG